MPTYQLGPNQAGKFYRVTIEQKVADVTGLVELQQRLAHVLPAFTAQSLADLHVTYLHLGRMNELFAEVRQSGTVQTLDAFLEIIQPVVQAGAQAVNASHEVRISGLDDFGFSDSVAIVATIHKESSWIAQRDGLMAELDRCLGECGITDVDRFIKASPNLKFGSREAFNPHVTLGTAPTGTPLAALLSTMSELPTIILEPTIVRNAPLR